MFRVYHNPADLLPRPGENCTRTLFFIFLRFETFQNARLSSSRESKHSFKWQVWFLVDWGLGRGEFREAPPPWLLMGTEFLLSVKKELFRMVNFVLVGILSQQKVSSKHLARLRTSPENELLTRTCSQ